MADFNVDLAGDLAGRLAVAHDPDEKIPTALDALGPIGDRDVLLVGGGPRRVRQLASIGARVSVVDALGVDDHEVVDRTADAIVSFWSAFRGIDPAEIAAADRILRPGGRLLIVHDYGRDDVSRLRGDQPEYGTWSRRDGPFLQAGFRIRVVHAFWRFDTLDAAAAFLAAAFGPAGADVSATLKRPRLSYNVAIFHRSRSANDKPA